MPALAQCSAICAPIVPAPSTATELIAICVISGSPAFDSVDEKVDDRIGLRIEVVLAPAQHPVGGHFIEGAEEDLGGGGGADVLAERAALLPVGNRLPDQLEVV